MRHRPVRPFVLIVGSEADPHIAAVAAHCRAAGARCEALSHETYFTLRLGNDGARLPREGLGEATAVWWRLKPGFFREIRSDPATLFIRREWTHTLEALERHLARAFWINPRGAERAMSHKPNQLQLALKCGLTIPSTVISNNPTVVQEFVARQPGKRAIHKVFSWFHSGQGETVYTNIVDLSFVSKHADSLKNCPAIFQEVVPKAYELRITVVGEKLFAARIESQSRSDTRIDWRRNQLKVRYSPVQRLPNRLARPLLAFHRKSGLRYGAYDFIVTPHGEFVFLEVNPAGQWLWIEDATGLPIASAMAKLLTSGQLLTGLFTQGI